MRITTELNMQLERYKNELQASTAKDLEEFRNSLRKENQANEIKRNDLMILLERIETVLDHLPDEQSQSYELTRRLIDKYNHKCCIDGFHDCDNYLYKLDHLCEEPGALTDPGFKQRLESMLILFKDATRAELLRFE